MNNIINIHNVYRHYFTGMFNLLFIVLLSYLIANPSLSAMPLSILLSIHIASKIIRVLYLIISVTKHNKDKKEIAFVFLSSLLVLLFCILDGIWINTVYAFIILLLNSYDVSRRVLCYDI